MLKHILVAVDETAPAAHAIECAACLAEKLGAQVTLLHVVDPVLATPIGADAPDVLRLTQLRVAGEALLERARVGLPAAVRNGKLLKEGDPAQLILQIAQEIDADLLVMGTQERERLPHFPLGTTLDIVIRRARCPVISVSERCKGAEQRGRRQAAADRGAAPITAPVSGAALPEPYIA